VIFLSAATVACAFATMSSRSMILMLSIPRGPSYPGRLSSTRPRWWLPSRQKKDEIRLWFIHLLRLTSSSSVQSVEVTKPPDCPSRSFLSFTYQICPKSQPKGAWREKEMRSAESESHGEGLFNSSSMDSPGLTKRPLGPMSRFIVTFHSRVLSVELESVGVGCDVKSETSRSSELNHPVAVARLIANRRGQRIYFRSQSQIAKSD
jgi:hypothetical protein